MGNPTVHNYGMFTHQGNLFRHLRTNNRFSATSVDQLPHHLAALWLFGHKFLFPIPDIDRSDYILMLGANPIASNGSIWTVPDVKKRIKALQARGGKLVLLDPRHTETAEVASEHHFITPGTDALFLLAVLNTLFAEGLDDDRAPGGLTPWPGGGGARYRGVHRGIRRAAHRHQRRHHPPHRPRVGAPRRPFVMAAWACPRRRYGALNQWLIQLINIATGNLDKPGGSLFTLPAVDQVSHDRPGRFRPPPQPRARPAGIRPGTARRGAGRGDHHAR